jgi:hypothetical protein
MPRRPRQSYLLPKTREHIWSSKVKNLTKEDQIELMRRWFDDRYTWPNELPHDSREGGYQWIWGGPYDAKDTLESEFGGVASDNSIKELVSELEDISYEWSGKPSDDDYDEEQLSQWIAESEPYFALINNLADIEDTAKRKQTVKDGAILDRLLFANVVTSLETYLGDALAKVLLARKDLLFHFYRTAERFRELDPKEPGTEPTEEHMKDAVERFLAWNIWHRMKKTAKVYKDALGIEFPSDLKTIGEGIRDRHDIVHRNGKSISGVMGSWSVADIVALKEAVSLFTTEIQGKIDKLPVPTFPTMDDLSIEF